MTKTKKYNKRNKKEMRDREAPKEVAADDEKSVDFGGIPVRDLKRNLGCG
jgi:hypothetical protein